MRAIICSVAMVLLAHPLEASDRAHLKTKQHQPSEWTIGIPRYVIGGIVGSTLGVALPLAAVTILSKSSYGGFGLFGSGFGHAIQGRWWDEQGWGFTMGSLYTLIALAVAEDEKDNRTFAWTLFIGTKLGELVTVWLPPRQSARARQEITTARYVFGGLLGTVIGFGSGHLMQGRGIAGAWPYTLTQVAALSAAFVEEKKHEDGSFSFTPPVLIGGVFWGISKIMEIISVWTPSVREYKIVSPADKPSAPKFAVFPLYHNARPKLVVQLTTAL